MLRVDAINQLLNEISKDALVVCSNGKIGRELFELRDKRGEPHNDFIMQGSMGCAASIALGIALNTEKEVYCLVGDGNLLMKLGTLATILKYGKGNLHIVVFDNGQHESTGGQPTSFSAIKNHLAFLRVIEVEAGSDPNLSRPTITPIQIKKNFIKKVNDIPTSDNQYIDGGTHQMFKVVSYGPRTSSGGTSNQQGVEGIQGGDNPIPGQVSNNESDSDRNRWSGSCGGAG